MTIYNAMEMQVCPNKATHQGPLSLLSSPLLPSLSHSSLLATTFIHQMKFADFSRKKTAKVSNCINLQKKDFVTFVLKKSKRVKVKTNSFPLLFSSWITV